ncbi:aspartate/glutamate racemase family protein [uncultured Propionivibrio sp.]|uniref:aspartate/glutamate racemase family protein n=1 Tax=uncultured Propionivibrio sp. TaxID=426737 RepID=UPI0029C08384|nr:aspartate/glutamate racemase family protein [uncultured Propionivibrio sp.]
MKKIVLLQTSMVSFDVFNRLFQEIIPEARVSNLVDEDLLDTLNRNRGITPSIIQRICQYCVAAEAAGADLIFSQCSSTREGIECARKMVKIPILMVDDAMAEQAVAAGSRIGVAATAAATLKPTSSALRSAAAAQGKDIEIKTYLADGALDVLMKERNRDKHDRLIIDLLKQAEQENDVIVLAQGSMVTIEPLLGEIKIPVLTSPKRGVIKARQLLLRN